MPEEERYGVRLTNLDQPLFAEAGATKRALVDSSMPSRTGSCRCWPGGH